MTSTPKDHTMHPKYDRKNTDQAMATPVERIPAADLRQIVTGDLFPDLSRFSPTLVDVVLDAARDIEAIVLVEQQPVWKAQAHVYTMGPAAVQYALDPDAADLREATDRFVDLIVDALRAWHEGDDEVEPDEAGDVIERTHVLDHDDDCCTCGGMWVWFEAHENLPDVYGCEHQGHEDALRHNWNRDTRDRVDVELPACWPGYAEDRCSYCGRLDADHRGGTRCG